MDYNAENNRFYDKNVYNKLGDTLRLSALMQKLAFYPRLMSFLLNRLNKNKSLNQMFFDMINGNVPKTRTNGVKFILKTISPFS